MDNSLIYFLSHLHCSIKRTQAKAYFAFPLLDFHVPPSFSQIPFALAQQPGKQAVHVK